MAQSSNAHAWPVHLVPKTSIEIDKKSLSFFLNELDCFSQNNGVVVLDNQYPAKTRSSISAAKPFRSRPLPASETLNARVTSCVDNEPANRSTSV